MRATSPSGRTPRTPTVLSVLVALVLLALPREVPAHGGGHGAPKAVSAANKAAAALSRPTPASIAAAKASTAARATPAGTRGADRRAGARAQTGGGVVFDASTGWEMWWEVNRDALLMGWDPRPEAATRSGWAARMSGKGRLERSLGEHETLIDTEIVPVLQSALRREDDQFLCDSAVLSLGRVCTPRLAPFVLRDIQAQLEHPVLSVQTAATLSLGVLGAPASLETLHGLMADTSAGRRAMGVDRVPWQVRGHAALALGLLGDPSSVPALADVVRHAPAGDRDLRASAVLALGLMHDAADQAGGALLTLLREDLGDHVVTSWVPVALGKLEDPTALPALLELVEDDRTDRLVQASAVLALGRVATIHHADVVEHLVETLDAADSAPRNFAFIALARIGARPVEHEDEQARQVIEDVLRREVERPSLRANRPWAALACGVYGRGRPLRRAELGEVLLERYDRENDPSVRAAFALGLGLLQHGDAARPILEDFQEKGDRGFRGYAALALGMLGRPEAIDPLLTVVVDETIEPEFRLQVARGLAVSGTPLATDVLIEALLETEQESVSWSMATALGRLADPRSIWPLIHVFEDPRATVRERAFAGLALGLVGERAPPTFTALVIEDMNYLAAVETIQGLVQL